MPPSGNVQTPPAGEDPKQTPFGALQAALGIPAPAPEPRFDRVLRRFRALMGAAVVAVAVAGFAILAGILLAWVAKSLLMDDGCR